MRSGCSDVPTRETTLDTGEGESLVSSHCLKSRDSLDGVGDEGTALEAVEEVEISLEELGRVGNTFGETGASARLKLEEEDVTSLWRLGGEALVAAVGGETAGSSRFL